MYFKRHRLQFIIFLFTGFIIFPSYSQSPWLQSPGEIYAQTGYYLIPSYNSLFLRSGESRQLDTYITNNTIQIFGEYGLNKHEALVLKIPFKIMATSQYNAQLSGFGNIIAGFKQSLIKKDMLLTAHLNIGFPTAANNSQNGLRTGYDAWSFNPMISTGRGYNKFYFQAYGGMQIRTNHYSTLLQAGGETGYKPLHWLWSIVYLDWLYSLRDGTKTPSQNQPFTALYVNDEEYFAWGMKFIAEFSEHFGIITGFAGSFSGHLVAHSPLIHIGMFKK